MSRRSAAGTTVTSSAQIDDGIAAQKTVTVYSCNRLGRIAKPPRFSFTNWLLRRR